MWDLAGSFRIRGSHPTAGNGCLDPTIRVNTRLVLVDVVVTDRKGQPVTGLKPEDFVLEENGKKQKISTFTTPEDTAKPRRPRRYPGHLLQRSRLRIARRALSATLVPFKAQVKPGDAGKLRVVFLVDAHGITAADASGGKKKLNVDLYSTIFSPEGKILANRSIKVAQEFPPEVYRQILSQGMLVPMNIDAQSGRNNQLRLALCATTPPEISGPSTRL
jgi:hypothetical protein